MSQPQPPAAPGKDRLTQAADHPLEPGSLVGSYFSGTAPAARKPGGPPSWRGCVVAEPAPGTYLVQLSSGEQRLAALSVMYDWEFWDTAQDAPPPEP